MYRLTFPLASLPIILLGLFWPAPSSLITAQPPPAPPPVPGFVTIPATVDVMAGRLASVTIESNGDVRWKMLGDELDSFREYDPDATKIRLRFIAYDVAKARGSRYSDPLIVAQAYLVATAVKDGKQTDIASCTVTFRRPEPLPPPVPPVPPTPPVPTDPFFAVLQGAWSQETDAARTIQLAQLASLFRLSGTSTVNDTSLKTSGDFLAVVQRAASAMLGPPTGSLSKIRAAIATELNGVMPKAPSAPLDAATRQLISTHFIRIATDLESLRP